MARIFAALLFICVVSTPSFAGNTFRESTGLANHDGFVRNGDTIARVRWQPIEAECEECDHLAKAYNDTMAQLMEMRYNQALMKDIAKKGKEAQKVFDQAVQDNETADKKGLGKSSQSDVASSLNIQETNQMLKEMEPEIQRHINLLWLSSRDLYAQLEACENRMCTTRGPESPPIGSMTGVKIKNDLSFDWKGPYPAVCVKCAKLADRLNGLPALAIEAISRLDIANSQKAAADLEIAIVQARAMQISAGNSGGGNKDMDAFMRAEGNAKIDRAEKMKKEATKAARDATDDLDKIRDNFKQTLALYNKCTPTCDTAMNDDEEAVLVPSDAPIKVKGGVKCGIDLTDALGLKTMTIGPNDQYGDSAQLRNKVTETAVGLGTSALGGLMGGGGGGSRGGGGMAGDIMGSDHGGRAPRDTNMNSGIKNNSGITAGKGQKGPNIVKDPLGGDYIQYTSNGYDLGFNAGFTKDGLVINQKIYDSPGGDSTFHAMWLQDGSGRKLYPKGYYIYDLYADHKLTMWWTYDHWTNGVHDFHDEGSEAQKWRTTSELNIPFFGEKGAKNSIWYQSGFDTAVKGVKSIGAIYALKPQDLIGGCSTVAAITYLSEPDKDPVTARPFYTGIHVEPSEADKKFLRDIQVTAKPF